MKWERQWKPDWKMITQTDGYRDPVPPLQLLQDEYYEKSISAAFRFLQWIYASSVKQKDTLNNKHVPVI